MNRLDRILADYEQKRQIATTLQQLQRAALTVVERIQALPAPRTDLERWVQAIFEGLSS